MGQKALYIDSIDIFFKSVKARYRESLVEELGHTEALAYAYSLASVYSLAYAYSLASVYSFS